MPRKGMRVMKAVVQRVCSVRVTVAGEAVAEAGNGLLALVGIARGDSVQDAEALGKKLVGLRIFGDEEGRMNRSLVESGGTAALVSQFTLLGDTRKGRRPSYVDAASPDEARPLFEHLVQIVREQGVSVVTGRFGAAMEVALVNDGPVTLVVDTH